MKKIQTQLPETGKYPSPSLNPPASGARANLLSKGPLLLACALLAAPWAHASNGDPDNIDVLVVHTPAVTSNSGGASGVESLAMASVASANDAMTDSAIPVVFNLVAVEEIAYTESSTSVGEDLDAISGNSTPVDPIHQDVLALRDAHGADLVTLFRRGPASGNSGIAFILDPEQDSADFGYAVVSDASAVSGLTFAHEIGHNLGAAHARGESGNPPALDEARGYTFSANGTDYRTIMSIDFAFSRIARYSNANATFNGTATGIPAGDPQAADNASAFPVSAPVTAGFRRTQTDVPTFLDEPVGDTVVAGGGARLRALLRGFPPLTVDWFRGEVGDTSQPLASTETELERGGTESEVNLANITATTKLWLRADNPNDTLDGGVFRVVLVPEPAGANPLVEQAVRDSGLIVSFPIEQEMTVPGPGYVRTLRLILASEGSPPNPTVRFEEIGGDILFERELDASQVAEWPNQSAQDFSVGLFAAPGAQYRVTLTPGDGQDDSNRILWHYAEAGSVTDPNVGDSNLVSDRRLMFSLLGATAWTYHTWLEDARPLAEAVDPQPSAANGGLPNLLRYAAGGGFDTPAPDLRPELLPLETTPGGEEAPFRFTRRPELADIELVVQESTDLETWTPVDAADIQSLGSTADGNDAFEARLPFDGDRLFLRLKANNPPASE